MRKASMILLILVPIIASFISCGHMPTQAELDKADFGKYPDDYQQTIKEYYSHQLRDPYSAQYRWIKPPAKGFFFDRDKLTDNPTKFYYGYIVFVGINAKNAYGGYVGEQEHVVLLWENIVRGVDYPMTNWRILATD